MRSKNSTTVRFNKMRLFQNLFSGLSLLSTRAAALLAERLFRSVSRRPESEKETQELATAKRYELQLAGQRLVAWHWGRGPIALLVHGWGGSAAQMLPFVSPLRKAGFSVLAFDAPAHGHSDGKLSSLPQFAAAIGELARHFGSPEVLITHSMGGAAASLAIAQGLSVRRAVFVAPPADALEWFEKFARMLKLNPSVARAMRRRTERKLQVNFDHLNSTCLGPALDMPLLVIHDRGDAEVLWYDGAAVAQSARQGSLLMTEGLGHRRILRDPGVIAESLKFLVSTRPNHWAFERVLPNSRCETCGEPKGRMRKAEQATCESCELERELFERERRWPKNELEKPWAFGPLKEISERADVNASR